eukprot:COSAG05_NODE_3073_length_2353_cov_1.701863_1_plen_335_part_00
MLNKVDQINKEQSQVLLEVCSSLNPLAKAVCSEFGKVLPTEILRDIGVGRSVADAFGDDDHQRAVQTVLQENRRKAAEEKAAAEAAAHGHDHGHAHGQTSAAVEPCTDEACSDSGSHGHGKHSKHGHGHGHGHASGPPTKPRSRHTDKYGIGSFVYSRRRPFHPVKLSRVIKQLPVSVNDALQLTSDSNTGGDTPAPSAAATEANAVAIGSETAESGMSRVVRSKGFSWLATYHTAALYWSHAGNHFELKNVGSWWAAVAPDMLPDGQVPEKVRGDFDGVWGDRRQEIIFIGRNLQEKKIVDALDACLLSDAEMEQYTKHWQGQGTQAQAQAAS